jgi:hypothetical protein
MSSFNFKHGKNSFSPKAMLAVHCEQVVAPSTVTIDKTDMLKDRKSVV